MQTPTVAIIAARENEINSFKPKLYYGIAAETKDFKLVWLDNKSGQNRTFDQNKRDQILAALSGKEARVVEVNKAYVKGTGLLTTFPM